MANLWRQFQQLLPTERTIVVTVQAVNAEGTSTVQTSAGATLVVQGDSVAAGGKAFVRAGRIEGKAPDLSVYEEIV